MSDSNIGWLDPAKMKAALEALRANKRSNAPKAKKPPPPAGDLVDLFGERVPVSEAPAAERGQGFIAATPEEGRPAFDDAGLEPAQARSTARIPPEIPPDQVRAIARAAAPEPQVENPSSLDGAFDSARGPQRAGGGGASGGSASDGLHDALSVLRDASPSPVPRHALEELGYESALHEFQRAPETAHAVAAPANLDDEDDDGLSLPVGDLDLHLRSSMSSVASIQPIRDSAPRDDLSDMLVFGEDDFSAPMRGGPQAGAEFSSADSSREPAPRSNPLRASAGFEAVGADETSAPLGAPAPLAGESSPGFTHAPSPAAGQTWERPEALMATREYRAVTDVEVRADEAARGLAEPPLRGQDSTVAGAPALTPAPAPAHDDDTSSLRITGSYPSVASPPAAAAQPTESSAVWRDAPLPSASVSVLSWLEQMRLWSESIEPDSLFFVADEGGLPLMTTGVSTTEIAVAVAMRQSIASLQALNHEEAPGFTVYRDSSGRYAHLLWAPSDYGIITVGVLSVHVQEDARLAVFSERLVAALKNLPLTG